MDMFLSCFCPAGLTFTTLIVAFQIPRADLLQISLVFSLLGFINYLHSARKHYRTIARLEFSRDEQKYYMWLNKEIRSKAIAQVAPFSAEDTVFDSSVFQFSMPRYLKVKGRMGKYHFHPRGIFDSKFLASWTKSSRK
ncbi:uncharacterized protein LOC134845547 [Symsagittifera roscoffensis]|uniref:uncharacterized protein LOC134845547 n=1 Tax=Symsagittifera roscoffensis TaxID=84072 RepID=UPI00307C1285